MGVPGEKLLQVQRLVREGKLAQARAAAQAIARQAPDEPVVNHMMADLCMRAGEVERALYFIERAAGGAPGDLLILSVLARIQGANRRFDDVHRTVSRLKTLDPRSHLPHLLEALTHTHEHRHMAAVVACREGLAKSPSDAELASTLAVSLLQCGEAPEAVRLLRDLSSRYPDNADIAGNYCLALNYVWGADPSLVRAAHDAYRGVLERTIGGPASPPPRPSGPDRPLRVGVISPDLRSHPVGCFIEPLFTHLDRASFRLHAYFTGVHEDAFTARLRAKADLWRAIPTGSPLSLMQTIRDDAVDILIELSGHTNGERLAAVQLRPAPVQATYCGYPNTTGLCAVDVRLVDSITDPPGPADALATERLERLDPCFLCYTPPAGLPPPSRASGGPVTFASFNVIQKVGDELLALWARVLEAAPGSTLILKAMNLREEALRARVAERAAKAGIDPGRLTLLPPAGTIDEHLATYARADIALDTHPYCGTTTTCEALAMGVPVVTLAGNVHASRVGASLLHAAGLPELVATDAGEYVRIASGLAEDRGRLASLRATLRGRLDASALCDGPAFCRRFEGALRGAWRRACG